MKRRGASRFAFVLYIFALTVNSVRAHTNTLTVPKEAQNKFGSVWADTCCLSDGGYAEQIYAASEFAEVPMDVFVITEVHYHPGISS